MKSTFDFSNEQNNVIYNILCGVKENPYEDYFRFSKDVRSVAVKQKVPDFLINVCDQIRVERREEKRHAHLLRNVPLDKHIPVFDQNDPVTDKYTKKTTFIGEAFLELFAQLTDTPLMAYETRNNGDFFHDVYAQKKI
jgi:L-asparagine oxygenase